MRYGVNLDVLERVVLKYLKLILNMKTSTPNFMVYGETGVYPIYINIYCRMISFWASIVSGSPTKLSYSIYRTAYSLYKFENNSNNKFKWFHTVRDILCSCGFSGVWDNQLFPNKTWLVSAVRQKLKDIFITNWLSTVSNSSSGFNYRILKNSFCFEPYLVSLPTKQRKFFMQIRTRNHRLPIETGRWQKIQREERVCNLCKSEIGDEFHYVLVCQTLKNVRKQYLNKYFYV